MKKFLFVATLFTSQFAFAGKIKELIIMAEDSVYEQLYSEGDVTLTFSNQELKSNKNGLPQINMEVVSRSSHTGRATVYFCSVDFKKSADFFEVDSTLCQ